MKGDYLAKLTAEDMQLIRIKAKETKDAKRLYAQENLNTDYGDDEAVWRALAKEVGFRLPVWYHPASNTKYVKKLLKHLGIHVKEWLEVEGFSKLGDFAIANPTWTALAHCGLVLEYWKEGK